MSHRYATSCMHWESCLRPAAIGAGIDLAFLEDEAMECGRMGDGANGGRGRDSRDVRLYQDRRKGAPVLAMGDPQASLRQVREVLRLHGGLDAIGAIPADRTVLSMGDHFDYRTTDEDATAEGLAVLSWLGGQPPNRVALLLGNHDLGRVCELSACTTETFRAAAEAARALSDARSAFARMPDPDRRAAVADLNRKELAFADRFPFVPTVDLAGRDWTSFSADQRDRVQRLLTEGRFSLAAVAVLPDGTRALATHAGVTPRELALLGCPDERDPDAITTRLNRFLDRRVEEVADRWQRGQAAPLDLAPLNLPGCGGVDTVHAELWGKGGFPGRYACGHEGGGLLNHRPARRDREGRDIDLPWEWNADRPRRFDPRVLPQGLVQVVGHVPNRRLVSELGKEWVPEDRRERLLSGLRVLRTDGVAVTLEPWEEAGPAVAGEATMIFVDVGLAAQDLDAGGGRWFLLPLLGCEVPR